MATSVFAFTRKFVSRSHTFVIESSNFLLLHYSIFDHLDRSAIFNLWHYLKISSICENFRHTFFLNLANTSFSVVHYSITKNIDQNIFFLRFFSTTLYERTKDHHNKNTVYFICFSPIRFINHHYHYFCYNFRKTDYIFFLNYSYSRFYIEIIEVILHSKTFCSFFFILFR